MLNCLLSPFTLCPEQLTFSLSITVSNPINQSFIQIISQLHSYGFPDIHNLVIFLVFLIIRGISFRLFPLISRCFTLLTITSITASSISMMLLELRSSKLMLLRYSGALFKVPKLFPDRSNQSVSSSTVSGRLVKRLFRQSNMLILS